MAKKITLILLLVSLTLGFVWSCSDRTSLSDPNKITTGGLSPKNHVFTQELLMQLQNKFQLIEINVYMPRASFPLHYGGSPGRKLPLLILLPPHGESADYFLIHGLKELADELISNGEIVPMYIATIPADPAPAFGGYFYAGSTFPAGQYDTLLGHSLADYISDTWEWPSDDPGQRGIGGVGTGAYGAFRAALVSPDAYSSISAVDGPLDFDGAPGRGNGLIDLMAYVTQTEQPGMTSNEMLRDTFDSSSSYPVSRMFIGGAMAFSPHDTRLDYWLEVYTEPQVPYRQELLIHIVDSTRGIPGYAIQDTTTFITRIVTEDVRNFDFHLPFDYSGTPYQPIWDLWLDDNLENLMTGNELDDVDLWIATSEDADYGFHDQTMAWVETLEDRGHSPTVREYSGYGSTGTSKRYLNELLREMLIFHSNNFKANSMGN